MAYVESAAVLYLRTIYGGIDPVGRRASPFDPIPDFLWVEIGREAATMVMLGAVGWLAGSGPAGRIGAFFMAMGMWDIWYYVFLWVFSGWPASLLAPDILFLIPLPWWGPVLAPTLVAAVLVVAGAAALARELGDGLPRPTWDAWLLVGVGIAICLVAFMYHAIVALRGGVEAAFTTRGGEFPWLLYLSGVVIGCVGLARGLTRAKG
jgi:hypothetical protein